MPSCPTRLNSCRYIHQPQAKTPLPPGMNLTSCDLCRHTWHKIQGWMSSCSLPPLQREDFPGWLRWQSICLQCRRPRFNPWVRKIPWRRKWQPTPLFLLEEFQGQRSLAGYSPWGCKESDTTERLPHLYRGTPGSACCGHQLQQSRGPSTQDPAVQHS